MTYYAINGSPRKTHNTATILNKALEGVKAADPQAQTELIHLYSHDFSGCVSCFEWKRLGTYFVIEWELFINVFRRFLERA